jgi:DNA helicase-2/ATP-dependent DNA helicase PcrA
LFLDELPADTVHWSRLEAAPASTGFGSAQARVAATGLSTGGLRGGAGNRAVISVDVGDRVSHDAFGLGTVVEVTGAGDKAQATVDFGSGGTKRLVLRYAPLVKL